MKLDKVLIYISLVILLLIILALGYLFLADSFQTTPDNKKVDIKKDETLNINKEEKIENPTSEDIENLIDELKEKNNQLEVN